MLKLCIFSNFLKKIFKNFRKLFKLFLQSFLKVPPPDPKKNPGYAHDGTARISVRGGGGFKGVGLVAGIFENLKKLQNIHNVSLFFPKVFTFPALSFRTFGPKTQ